MIDSPTVAPPSVLEHWADVARADRHRVVLADRGDDRAYAAAARLKAGGLVEPIVFDPVADTFEAITGMLPAEAVENLRTVLDEPRLSGVIDRNDPLVIAAGLVRSGWADAGVGGASRPTSDVVRACLRVIGKRSDIATVSSSVFFVLPCGRTVLYGDCGVIPEPNADQLATIAIACAETYTELTGDPARVAMLSFSTSGSADHPCVEKVRTATRLVRHAAPELVVDGELQFDAAFLPDVAAVKAPNSAIAGSANVFVFPDLDAGNIGYKITERLAGARAFGPLLQGLDGVFHDLSRGCSIDDIVHVALIAAVQSTRRVLKSVGP